MVFNIVLRSEKLWLGLLIAQLMVWLVPALKLPKLKNDPRNLEIK